MNMFPIYITLHIIFAGIWLSFFIIELVLRSRINKEISPKENANNYLVFTNVFGNTGAIGILLTGILLVVNSGYGFFDMSSNHWLATKQIILVVIFIVIFAMLIPTMGKVREDLKNDSETLPNNNLKKLFKANLIINILVLLNFLFAITRHFYS